MHVLGSACGSSDRSCPLPMAESRVHSDAERGVAEARAKRRRESFRRPWCARADDGPSFAAQHRNDDSPWRRDLPRERSATRRTSSSAGSPRTHRSVRLARKCDWTRRVAPWQTSDFFASCSALPGTDSFPAAAYCASEPSRASCNAAKRPSCRRATSPSDRENRSTICRPMWGSPLGLSNVACSKLKRA